MHANCNRTTDGFAQLNIEYSILYQSPVGSAQKASPMLFYFYLFWCYFLLCAGKQTAAATHTSGQGWAGRECKASRRGEKEKSNYTAQ